MGRARAAAKTHAPPRSHPRRFRPDEPGARRRFAAPRLAGAHVTEEWARVGPCAHSQDGARQNWASAAAATRRLVRKFLDGSCALLPQHLPRSGSEMSSKVAPASPWRLFPRRPNCPSPTGRACDSCERNVLCVRAVEMLFPRWFTLQGRSRAHWQSMGRRAAGRASVSAARNPNCFLGNAGFLPAGSAFPARVGRQQILAKAACAASGVYIGLAGKGAFDNKSQSWGFSAKGARNGRGGERF